MSVQIWNVHRRKKPHFLLGFTTVLLSVLCVIQNRRKIISQQTALESRHPLYQSQNENPSRKLRETGSSPLDSLLVSAPSSSSILDPWKIRYLAFGSIDTWGEGLKQPEVEAYPFRFNSLWQTRNAATRTNDVFMAAACTQSIIQDEIYDVVSIEFAVFTNSHTILAKRIRNRFPLSTIIFLQIWKPSHVMYEYDNGTTIDLNTWRKIYNHTASLHSNELALEMMEAGPEKWSVLSPSNWKMKSTSSDVNAHLLSLPAPDSQSFAFPSNIRAFFLMFQEEAPYHLTSRGHEMLFHGIKEHMKQRPPSENRKNRDVTGSWGSGDSCHLWYHTGQYVGQDRLNSGRAVDFSFSHSGSHKHAIEFRGVGGTLRLSNPFQDRRMLYLTYMTASDEESLRIYPRAKVRLNGVPSLIIDPYHDGHKDEHLARTTAVGMIPPGETLLELIPLQKARFQFRLVGYSVLSDDMGHFAEIEFSLESEPSKEDDSPWKIW